MKHVLITGSGSYVGSAIESRLLEDPVAYQVETLDMRTDAWRDADFSSYDSIFHVAGIAHVPTKNIDNSAYMKVNRDLAISVAKKSKVIRSKTDGFYELSNCLWR